MEQALHAEIGYWELYLLRHKDTLSCEEVIRVETLISLNWYMLQNQLANRLFNVGSMSSPTEGRHHVSRNGSGLPS